MCMYSVVLPLQLGELHKILDGRINSGEPRHSVYPKTCWYHIHNGAVFFHGLWHGDFVVPPNERLIELPVTFKLQLSLRFSSTFPSHMNLDINTMLDVNACAILLIL